MIFSKALPLYLKQLGLASLLLVALHPNAWKISHGSYQKDSLFVLSPIEIGGLICLTMIMANMLFLGNMSKTVWLHSRLEQTQNSKSKHYWIIPFDLFLTVTLFLLFWAIAPQIHYLYYQQIMDGLQNQWVIGGGMKVEKALRFVTLSQENSIANHANGLALWLCLFSSALYPMVKFNPKWMKILLTIACIIATFRLLQILLIQ